MSDVKNVFCITLIYLFWVYQVHKAEFVILCIGKYSGLPNIPEFSPGKGPEIFEGKVMHSMDYSALDNDIAAELIKNKRVTIIGSEKSALDIASECANANGKNKFIYNCYFSSSIYLFFNPFIICI